MDEFQNALLKILGEINKAAVAIALRHGDQPMCDVEWRALEKPITAGELEAAVEALRRMRNGN